MDRGIWATWYDLDDADRDEFLTWLHGEHLPAMRQRPGYLWAANVENVMTPEREEGLYRRVAHTADPSVPGGNQFLLLFGAESPHTFVHPTPEALVASLPARSQGMLGRMRNPRQAIWLEVARVDGPAVAERGADLAVGPIVQFGQFNINRLENEADLESWYAAHRLQFMTTMPGCVGARELVSIVGWAKHAILYEFTWLETMEQHWHDPSPWSAAVVRNLVHAPHSPSLGRRVWP